MVSSCRAGGVVLPVLLLASSAVSPAEDAVVPAAGAYERSLALARQTLARRPGDESLLRVLASVHFRRGKFRDAILGFEEVLRVNSANLEAQLGIAQSYLQLEDLDAAEREFRRILTGRESQQVAQSRRDLADILYRRGRYSEGAQLLRAALERGDRSADMWLLLGRALDGAARVARAHSRPSSEIQALEAEAAAALREALRGDPAEAQAHFLLAGLARRQGDGKAAAAEIEAYRRLKPGGAPADLKDVERADGLFEARTALELGRALFAAKDAEGAVALVDHALKLIPDFTEGQAFRSWIAMQSGRLEEAAAGYRAILAREPRHAEALWNLGRMTLKGGDAQAAAALFLQAAEARPRLAEAWEMLLTLAEDNGIHPERAEEYGRQALRARPSPRNHTRLAMTLFSAGKLTECRAVVEEGLKRYPQDPDLLGARQALQEAGQK